MKHEKTESALRRLGSVFTRNFGLKILSLALAVLIYEVLKPEAGPTGHPQIQTLMAVSEPSADRTDPPAAEKEKESEKEKEAAKALQTAELEKHAASEKKSTKTTRTNSTKTDGKSRK